MKRFILCALLLHTTSVIPDSESTSSSIPFENIAAISAVLFIPGILSQLHTWWTNYSLDRLDDITLLGEIQKRLFIFQEPFQPLLKLVQQYPLDSIDNYYTLKQEIHECVISVHDNDTYKYLLYGNKLDACIRNLQQLHDALQKRMNTLNSENTLYHSYATVHSTIDSKIATLTSVYNYLKNTDEYAQDYHNNLSHNAHYSPDYLQ